MCYIYKCLYSIFIKNVPYACVCVYIYIYACKYTQGFPGGSAGKDPPAMREIWVQSLGWEDPSEKGKAPPFHYSGLENSMDCIVHGVTKSRTRLSDFHFTSIPYS